MNTIVYQSYRTTRVPHWIEACMQSVRGWANGKGYEYRFFDDSFFDYAPIWFREKANHEICPVTDLARLIVAKKLLAEGFDRSIWVDADILVFVPGALVVDLKRDFAFCHEAWLYTDAVGKRHVSHRVNNSITAFHKHNVHLDFFIDACLRVANDKASIGKLDVGTDFLSQLRYILPYPLLTNVAMLSPAMMVGIAAGDERPLIEYMQQVRGSVACANFCGSLQGRTIQGAIADETVFESVVDTLLAGAGDVLNRHAHKRPFGAD